MKKTFRWFALAALLPAGALAQVFVSESFADGERATQSPPNSLQWYSTFASSMSVSSGAMRISPTSSTVRAGTAYFTSVGSPVALGLGEVLTLSLTFAPTGTATLTSPNGLRFGVFDSGGVRLTGDANPTDNAYRGYAAFVNPLTSNARISERIGTGALLTSLSAGVYDATPIASGVGTTGTLNFEAGESYTASLTVTRTLANQWLIGFSLSGGNLGTYSFVGEDTASFVTQFDTISFGLNSDMTATDFTNFTVSVAAIPEPGTYALLVGAVALLGVCGWRRRRAAV